MGGFGSALAGQSIAKGVGDSIDNDVAMQNAMTADENNRIAIERNRLQLEEDKNKRDDKSSVAFAIALGKGNLEEAQKQLNRFNPNHTVGFSDEGDGRFVVTDNDGDSKQDGSLWGTDRINMTITQGIASGLIPAPKLSKHQETKIDILKKQAEGISKRDYGRINGDGRGNEGRKADMKVVMDEISTIFGTLVSKGGKGGKGKGKGEGGKGKDKDKDSALNGDDGAKKKATPTSSSDSLVNSVMGTNKPQSNVDAELSTGVDRVMKEVKRIRKAKRKRWGSGAQRFLKEQEKLLIDAQNALSQISSGSSSRVGATTDNNKLSEAQADIMLQLSDVRKHIDKSGTNKMVKGE